MGEELGASSYFTTEQRRRYRERVQLCLDVFERLLVSDGFDSGTDSCGLEVELSLVDSGNQPSMNNLQVLDCVADPGFQTELGRFNIEYNVPPGPLSGSGLRDLEQRICAAMDRADDAASRCGSAPVMVGVLPTLMPEHLDTDWMTPSPRYGALNDAIFTSRGEDLFIDIRGRSERLALYADSIAPESACTSVQLHLQVAPSSFAVNWNAAQLLAAPQVALAANSPFLFGRRLWDETRPELFKQSTDTRPAELRNQGVRPRVFFGDRWVTSIFDLFEENVRYFPALLPQLSDEDPVAELEAGRAPSLSELRLHNGTVYRWNRPIYDVSGDRPHLRVENRVLPAGPTVVDTVANAAFFYGCLKILSEGDRPLWSKVSLAIAERNFQECCRQGLDARVTWPGIGEVSADQLVLRKLLPMARRGLERWGVDPEVSDRYLSVVAERARSGQNGARWQASVVRKLQDGGVDRAEALARMLGRYRELSRTNQPAHSWPVD